MLYIKTEKVINWNINILYLIFFRPKIQQKVKPLKILEMGEGSATPLPKSASVTCIAIHIHKDYMYTYMYMYNIQYEQQRKSLQLMS